MKKLKMSKKTWWITGIVLLIVILAVWLIQRYRKVNQPTNTNENNDGQNSTATFPLQYGSRGPEVENLQEWLQSQGQSLPEYGVDGIFMNETKSALKAVTGLSKVSQNNYIKMLDGTYEVGSNFVEHDVPPGGSPV